MANYSKTTWATGDVVTSTKLNNMESGIEKACSYAYLIEPQFAKLDNIDIDYAKIAGQGDDIDIMVVENIEEIYDLLSAGKPVFMQEYLTINNRTGYAISNQPLVLATAGEISASDVEEGYAFVKSGTKIVYGIMGAYIPSNDCLDWGTKPVQEEPGV